MQLEVVPDSERRWDCDLALLAIGFTGADVEVIGRDQGIQMDQRGNVLASDADYRTSVDGVFVAGDMRRGQSLVVWAIREGRQAAEAIHQHLLQ